MKTTSSDFINRELSWLEFNQRVLEEAQDQKIPLLERVKFLAITASNLDEFYMVRAGGLHLLIREGRRKRDVSGMTPIQQMNAISKRVHRMVTDQFDCLLNELEPRLVAEGVTRIRPEALSQPQKEHLRSYFEDEIYPVITPMAVSTHQNFPLLVNQWIYLGVRLKGPKKGGAPLFSVLPIGKHMSRFITLPDASGFSFILLEDVVRLFIRRYFPEQQIMECVPFRITRNADLALEDDLFADLLQGMDDLLQERKKSDCIRLEVAETSSQLLLRFLKQVLNVHDRDVYKASGPLDLSAYFSLAGIEGHDDLKSDGWPPQAHPDVSQTRSIFKTLSQQDLLLCHPFDSFEPVLRLIEEAAEDPDVLAIKQILYRTSKHSPIVEALKKAALNEKTVTVVVELKARFDEARNIEWAMELEEAGVQVIYGIRGLKTHAKICVVVRREPQGIQRYVHYGTGNYNETTARLYTDISLMTSHEDFGADASTFFNTITGFSLPSGYRKIAAAPLTARERILELIDGEIARKKQGQEAFIRVKVNSLSCKEIITALYRASQAGVQVDLNIRGICCLRPGVPGLSEHIRVVSIVDRFLEHSRIMQFRHGGENLVFISSADWMARNLDRRIELVVPVENSACKKRLIHILDTCLKDTEKGRLAQPDGTYVRLKALKSGKKVRAQEQLYKQALEFAKVRRQAKRTDFEPHRPPTKKLR